MINILTGFKMDPNSKVSTLLTNVMGQLSKQCAYRGHLAFI